MVDPTKPHVVWHEHANDRSSREKLAGHRAAVVWFTGLSGSGKSTIANALDAYLHARQVRSYVLDGDNVRHGLCAGPQLLEPGHGKPFAERFGLGFGPEDRVENIRRVGAVAKLMVDAGLVVLTAFVSPYRADRDAVRETLEAGDFIEVFVDTPIEVCESRDPKGLYKMARDGKIRDFTGIDAPYEPPLRPELVLDGSGSSVEELAGEVVRHLCETGVVSKA